MFIELGRRGFSELCKRRRLAAGRHGLPRHADYEANHVAPDVTPLDMAQVIKTIQRLAPPDTVYTNGAGNFSAWPYRYTRYYGLQHYGRTQLAPTSGAMGYGAPRQSRRPCFVRERHCREPCW